MHPQTITEIFQRNRIASGFKLYQLFLQHHSLPSLVCKINLNQRAPQRTIIVIGGPVLNSLGPTDVILPFLL